jgi:hypothetical protein
MACTMMVAVAALSSPPFQHSPIFGHLASSQTVLRFNSLNVFFNSVYFSPVGIGALSHDGRRPAEPSWEVTGVATFSQLLFFEMKYSSPGPSTGVVDKYRVILHIFIFYWFRQI